MISHGCIALVAARVAVEVDYALLWSSRTGDFISLFYVDLLFEARLYRCWWESEEAMRLDVEGGGMGVSNR